MSADLDELERLISAASDLPWKNDCFLITSGKGVRFPLEVAHLGIHGERRLTGEQSEANAALIAAAVNALPDLIRRVREAEEKVDVMRISLEMIAVGDVVEPNKQAECALEITGYWEKEQTK